MIGSIDMYVLPLLAPHTFLQQGGLNSGHGHLRYGVWDLVRDCSSVRDSSAALQPTNPGRQDIDFGFQQVVLGTYK